MYREGFVNQVKLLLQCLPAIRDQDDFVIKGGTAINLLIQDMPRLSVDIDLTYKRIEDRIVTIQNIEKGLRNIALKIKKNNSEFVIKEQINRQDNSLIKLFVYHQSTMVKIEPNFVMRGTLLKEEYATLSPLVNSNFGAFLDQIPMLSVSEVYAGKICAALSRQHPRDLFDIKLLLETQGLTEEIRQAFVVYLACDTRPMHELLSPNRINIDKIFDRDFSQMTNYIVTLDSLLDTREKLIKAINSDLSENERLFLLSVKTGNPRFELLPFKGIDKLPALRWKLRNIGLMDKKKHLLMVEKLRTSLCL
jgi:predicted nucleotidyltransferase component of viral defense system